MQSNSNWQRPQGRGNNRNSNSGSNAPGKDGGRQNSQSGPAGNAWKGKAAAGGDRAQTPSTPVQAEHRPVKDFNSNEVRDFLKKSASTSILVRNNVGW
jgi:hypothetical protein